MKKEQYNYNRGFSIIEVVLASALLGIFVTAFMGVFFFGQEAISLSANRVSATIYAEEGLEIVRNIRDDNFNNLVSGARGVATSSNQWVFSGSSDTRGIFTRVLTISEINPNEKEVVSDVTWQQNGQRVGSVSLAARFTSWKDAIPVPVGGLVIDISNSSFSVDNTQILGVTLENTGNTAITIVDIETSWIGVPGNRRITEVAMDGLSLWTGNDKSGNIQDIIDQPISPFATISLDFLRFNNDASGIEITITFNLLSGGSETVVFTPGSPPPSTDTTPPDPVSDLVSTDITGSSATLAWTATGDDGAVGTATTYDIRYSNSNITEANWPSATQIVGEPSPQAAGSPETLLVSGLSPSTTYYFAMKTSDEVPNESALSNVTSFTTLASSQASFLTVDTSGVLVDSGDNTRVIGIELGNTDTSSITITTVIVSWTGAPGGNKIQGVEINSSVAWTGSSNSGATLDITDRVLPAGVFGIPLELDFRRNMTGTAIDITFNMGDGSQKIVTGITP